MTEMSSDMLKFVKEWIPKLEKADLAHVLSEIDHIITQSAKDKGIKFQLNILGELPPLKCDAQMIQSAVMDIVSNAIDACIWKVYENKDTPKVVLKAYLQHDEPNVIIEVIDNGCGMTEEVKASIFKPFFSTKSKTGTGLGLSIASRMINAHKGNINVESELDKGTMFQIILPINKDNGCKENYHG